MAKREFLLLAHKYDPAKYHVNGWYMSEKLDGMRAFWDGGITRGEITRNVPWANVEKDGRLIRESIATGLWSRYGKVIYAPGWWLDAMPRFPLDGELYLGPQQFQRLASIVKHLIPNDSDWREVRYAAIDSPPFELIFKDGEINVTNFKKSLSGCLEWARPRMSWAVPQEAHLSFNRMVRFLETKLPVGPAYPHPQIELPYDTRKTERLIEERLSEVCLAGGEGLCFRKHISIWTPSRSHELLKYKPFEDAEGTVVGYTWGRETDKGSKLLGKMGALVLSFNGKTFELSGFTDEERIMTLNPLYEATGNEPLIFQGRRVSRDYFNQSFPLGSRVTFRYRELTNDGIPKEARYLRKAGA